MSLESLYHYYIHKVCRVISFLDYNRVMYISESIFQNQEINYSLSVMLVVSLHISFETPKVNMEYLRCASTASLCVNSIFRTNYDITMML